MIAPFIITGCSNKEVSYVLEEVPVDNLAPGTWTKESYEVEKIEIPYTFTDEEIDSAIVTAK